jgi:hypothetical protein
MLEDVDGVCCWLLEECVLQNGKALPTAEAMHCEVQRYWEAQGAMHCEVQRYCEAQGQCIAGFNAIARPRGNALWGLTLLRGPEAMHCSASIRMERATADTKDTTNA